MINKKTGTTVGDFDRPPVFERDPEDITREELTFVGEALLTLLGEDPERDGLKDTPSRFANMWLDFITYDDPKRNTTFIEDVDEIVMVRDIRVFSFCEHHLLPFWVDLTIGYIPVDGVILGLSKFARIAHQHAHKLQTQERLIEDIAREITAVTTSPNVAIIGRGVHTCMIMRGIKTNGEMITSLMRGAFYNKPEARDEFLKLVRI